MTQQQGPGCTVGFSFGVLVIMALVGLLLLAGGGSGGGTTNSNTRTETHVLSDNNVRILSPDTNIYVNSGNPQTTQDNRITGNSNNVQPPPAPTADPAALQRAIDRAAQGGKP